MPYLLLLHGGNPLDELLIAGFGAAILIGGWIAIKMAPAPDAADTVVGEEAEPEPEVVTPGAER